ncbi:MAG: 3-oxoadipate enol-lactonase [Burkholderiales bacterium]
MHVEANGIRIHYEVEGDGPWLVTSHSLACSSAMWRAQVDALKGSFRVLSFDTRGHGQSDAPAGAYTLDQLSDDLQGLLDALRIERPHFMGLSMGGMIGMTHALRHPGRLQSLVLCDTTSRIPAEARGVWQQRIDTAQAQGMEPLVASTLQRWFTAPFLARGGDAIARVGDMIRRTPAAGYVGCCHAIRAIDLTDQLGAVTVPTLVVVGDQDVGTPVEASRAIHLAIPGAQLGVIPSASHLSNLEQPETFNHLVGRFLASVR